MWMTLSHDSLSPTDDTSSVFGCDAVCLNCAVSCGQEDSTIARAPEQWPSVFALFFISIVNLLVLLILLGSNVRDKSEHDEV